MYFQEVLKDVELVPSSRRDGGNEFEILKTLAEERRPISARRQPTRRVSPMQLCSRDVVETNFLEIVVQRDHTTIRGEIKKIGTVTQVSHNTIE